MLPALYRAVRNMTSYSVVKNTTAENCHDYVGDLNPCDLDQRHRELEPPSESAHQIGQSAVCDAKRKMYILTQYHSAVDTILPSLPAESQLGSERWLCIMMYDGTRSSRERRSRQSFRSSYRARPGSSKTSHLGERPSRPAAQASCQ